MSTTQPPSDTRSLVRLLEWRATSSPDRVALSIWAGGAWREFTYGALFERARVFGSQLIAGGVAHGDRVVILAEPRPEWAIAFFAVRYAGAIAVPIDPRIEEADLRRILLHCQPRVVLTSKALHQRMAALQSELKSILIDEAPDGPVVAPLDRDDDAALVAYTSGTTGEAKGAMITAAGLLYQMRSLAIAHGLGEDDVFLSVLPLNHLFELTCGLLSVLYAGGEVLYAGTLLPADLAEKMQTRGVTSMIAVPALYQTLKKTIESLYGGGVHFRVRRLLARLVLHRRSRQFLFPELRRVAGTRLKRFICGGSPLDRETLRFFNGIGAPIYVGYGLTETSPVVAVNAPGASREGSVGRPLAGTEVTLAGPDGEILVRGPQVMRGYYNAPELTAQAIDSDGWFHTGDLGRMKNGFLFITGRLKELVVLADGRKVQPEEVELVLGRCARVKEICVVSIQGDRGEEICAVVVSADPPAEVEEEVRQAAMQLRDFKRPRRIMVRAGELPKTRTLKIRRRDVQNWVVRQMQSPT